MLKAIKSVDFQAEFDLFTNFYNTDFNHESLKTQLAVLSTNFKEKDGMNVLPTDVIDVIKSPTPAQKTLLSHVCMLGKLLLAYACNKYC